MSINNELTQDFVELNDAELEAVVGGRRRSGKGAKRGKKKHHSKSKGIENASNVFDIATNAREWLMG
jgi:hypothetical protein